MMHTCSRGSGRRRSASIHARITAVAAFLVTTATVLGQSGLTISPPTPLNSNAAADNGDDYDVKVKLGADGVLVAVWTSEDDLGGTIGTDADILSARSTDGGATWSDPITVNSNAEIDSNKDTNAGLFTDGEGTWVVAWQARNSGDSAENSTSIRITRSADNGESWEDLTQLGAQFERTNAWNSSVHVATDGAGDWIVVWSSQEDLNDAIGPDWDILSARSIDSGATWSNPTPVNSAAISDTYIDSAPRVATDARGTWIAVWESSGSDEDPVGSDDDIFVARSTNDGLSWSIQTPLNDDALTDAGRYADWDHDRLPRLQTDGAGTWVATWEYYYKTDSELRGGLVRTATSFDGGLTWLNRAKPYIRSDIPTKPPEPIWSESGGWGLIWTANDHDTEGLWTLSHSVKARFSADGLNWQDEVIPYQAYDPDGSNDRGTKIGRVSADTDGVATWIGVWSERHKPDSTLGVDWDVMISLSEDNGASWRDATPLNVNAATDGGDDQAPLILSIGGGYWLAAWVSNDSLGETIGDDKDILFARLVIPDCNGNYLNDAEDLASGVSNDCNGNGVPDECDISSGVSEDCNGNGVPDECDIESGVLTDENENGVADQCDPCSTLGLGTLALLLSAALVTRFRRV